MNRESNLPVQQGIATYPVEARLAVGSMNRSASTKYVTWFNVCFSLFSMIVIRQSFRAITPEPGAALALAREACMFLSAGVLVWLVRRKERLPLRSIGIGTSRLWKSLAWGIVIAAACIVPAALIAKFSGYGNGPASHSLAKLPIWVVLVIVARAGIVEELFYRGYPIEGLKRLGFGRTTSWLIPLIMFSAAHWTGGPANVVMALTLGAVLTAFYQWRRDLVSNMFGHFLVDFVTNVLPAILS